MEENKKKQNCKKDKNVEKEKIEKQKDNKKNDKLIATLKKELQEKDDKLLRLNAEIQNIKRHAEEEKNLIIKYDGQDLIKAILETIDNFERAIIKDDDNLDDELSKFLSGFKMIYTNLIGVLNTYGVKEIEALHKEFDPNSMQAVLTDKNDKYESNIVTEVLQKGYIYKDKIIRPAMVKVNE